MAINRSSAAQYIKDLTDWTNAGYLEFFPGRHYDTYLSTRAVVSSAPFTIMANSFRSEAIIITTTD